MRLSSAATVVTLGKLLNKLCPQRNLHILTQPLKHVNHQILYNNWLDLKRKFLSIEKTGYFFYLVPLYKINYQFHFHVKVFHHHNIVLSEVFQQFSLFFHHQVD
jgi:hypothetical protein